MQHFMIVLKPYIYLLNLSLIIKCLFLRNIGAFNFAFEKNILQKPLYNNITGIHSKTVLGKQPCYIPTRMYRLFRKVTICGISKQKCIDYIEKKYHLWSFFCRICTFLFGYNILGSIFKSCYIQNCALINSFLASGDFVVY